MEITDPALLREFKWRSFLSFIDYDWEQSKPWQEYSTQNGDNKDSGKDSGKDELKRKFYTEFVDP